MQLFFAMMRAGWIVPAWLKEAEWSELQLVELDIPDVKKLPAYSPAMPITIVHQPDFLRHIVEKTITLRVGGKRSFRFTDHYGEEVLCHINAVYLIDLWKETEERFSDPKYTENILPEQLQTAKKHCYEALEQCCPREMRYVGIEYACSKEISLQFYSKAYLKAYPGQQNRRASVGVCLKPDLKTGAHHLPLKGCVMEGCVSADTAIIPGELFCYTEKIETWEETV